MSTSEFCYSVFAELRRRSLLRFKICPIGVAHFESDQWASAKCAMLQFQKFVYWKDVHNILKSCLALEILKSVSYSRLYDVLKNCLYSFKSVVLATSASQETNSQDVGNTCIKFQPKILRFAKVIRNKSCAHWVGPLCIFITVHILAVVQLSSLFTFHRWDL